MQSLLPWIQQHPEAFALVAYSVVSLVSGVAKNVLTPEFEESHPGYTKVIRIFAKLTSDVFGAYLEAKKKPAPTSEPTIVYKDDSK